MCKIMIKEYIHSPTRLRHISIHRGTNTTSQDQVMNSSSLSARNINWSIFTEQNNSNCNKSIKFCSKKILFIYENCLYIGESVKSLTSLNFIIRSIYVVLILGYHISLWHLSLSSCLFTILCIFNLTLCLYIRQIDFTQNYQ